MAAVLGTPMETYSFYLFIKFVCHFFQSKSNAQSACFFNQHHIETIGKKYPADQENTWEEQLQHQNLWMFPNEVLPFGYDRRKGKGKVLLQNPQII